MKFGSLYETSASDVASLLLRHAYADPKVLGSIRRKYRLTATQARVAVLLADRLTNDEIADQLRIKSSTARRHTEAVMFRLNVNSRFNVVTRLAEFFAEDA